MISDGELWNERMSVGVGQIDEHHKVLIRLMIECREALDTPLGHEMLKETLAALVSYSKYHFLAEERLMLEVGFPFLEAQRRAHREVSDKLSEVVSKYYSEPAAFKRELFGFLKDWFVNHIVAHDTVIGAYVRQHRGGEGG